MPITKKNMLIMAGISIVYGVLFSLIVSEYFDVAECGLC